MEKKLVERYVLARQKLNLTYQEIADLLGCSTGVISGIELNRIEVPNFKYVEFLVNKGINFDYLTGKSSQILASDKIENTEALDVLKDEIQDLKQTIKFLLGELERLKTIHQKTWANEQGERASVGKSRTVGISGIGRKFTVDSQF